MSDEQTAATLSDAEHRAKIHQGIQEGGADNIIPWENVRQELFIEELQGCREPLDGLFPEVN